MEVKEQKKKTTVSEAMLRSTTKAKTKIEQKKRKKKKKTVGKCKKEKQEGMSTLWASAASLKAGLHVCLGKQAVKKRWKVCPAAQT